VALGFERSHRDTENIKRRRESEQKTRQNIGMDGVVAMHCVMPVHQEIGRGGVYNVIRTKKINSTTREKRKDIRDYDLRKKQEGLQ